MKLIALFITLLALVTFDVEAAPVKRLSQQVKLPIDSMGGQNVLRHDIITNPAVADTAGGFSANAGNTSTAAVTVTTFLAQPSVARNVVITPGGTTADVGNCDVVVNGTNIQGGTISETLSFAANASSATTGAKAFKTITSVVFPLNCEDSPFTATWSLGYGEKLGLNRCQDGNFYLGSAVAGTRETTAPTVVFDVDEVEKNTMDFNGTMDGTADFDVFYVENYNAACFP